jgi:xanthine/CO dehydrogenase XdhC/CoxF family maturation factor
MVKHNENMRSAPSVNEYDDDIWTAAAEWRASGVKVAFATVVETWGSSPRPIGSQLAVAHDGRFLGSVSGGCVESAVVQEALAVIASGEPTTLEFGVSDETAWDVGLACGGTIRVFVEQIS